MPWPWSPPPSPGVVSAFEYKPFSLRRLPSRNLA